MLGALFARTPAPAAVVEVPPVPVAKTIEALTRTAALVERRIEFLEREAARFRREALVHRRAGRKKLALLSMRRIKLYSAQAARLSPLQESLDRQRILIEAAAMQLETLGALRDGAATLRDLSARSADADQVMEEVTQQLADQSDIDESIARPIDTSMVYDDDALDADLTALELEAGVVSPPVAVARVPAAAEPPGVEDVDDDAEYARTLEMISRASRVVPVTQPQSRVRTAALAT